MAVSRLSPVIILRWTSSTFAHLHKESDIVAKRKKLEHMRDVEWFIGTEAQGMPADRKAPVDIVY